MISIENGRAYVDTVAEALEVSDRDDIVDVVITDRAEELKMIRLMKGYGLL